MLYFAAPVALFLLTLWVIMFVVDEVVIYNFQQDRDADRLGKMQEAFFNGKKGWSVPWYVWVVALMFLIGALSDKT